VGNYQRQRQVQLHFMTHEREMVCLASSFQSDTTVYKEDLSGEHVCQRGVDARRFGVYLCLHGQGFMCVVFTSYIYIQSRRPSHPALPRNTTRLKEIWSGTKRGDEKEQGKKT
jgi:hypothetical protein